MAERSLSTEQDWTGGLFLPEFTTNGSGQRIAVINSFNTVNPIIDAAHQIGPSTISAGDPANPITAGTKLGFTDEHTIGFEQQLPKNFTFSARYIDRRAKRIVEDAASVSPEGSLACDQPLARTALRSSISSATSARNWMRQSTWCPSSIQPAAQCLQAVRCSWVCRDTTTITGTGKSVCFAQTGVDPDTDVEINSPDGNGDGFPRAVRNYKAPSSS